MAFGNSSQKEGPCIFCGLETRGRDAYGRFSHQGMIGGSGCEGARKAKYEAEISELKTNLAAAEKRVEKLSYQLKEASKAGTALWHERDAQNGMILENQQLQEKLALSEAAGAEARHALEMLRELYVLRINGGKTLTILDNHIIVAMNKALASDHGKAYLDVVRAAIDYREKDDILRGHYFEPEALPECLKAKQAWIDALDRLPGRKKAGIEFPEEESKPK